MPKVGTISYPAGSYEAHPPLDTTNCLKPRLFCGKYHVLGYKFGVSNQGIQSSNPARVSSHSSPHLQSSRRHQASQSIFVALLYNCITQSDRLGCFKSQRCVEMNKELGWIAWDFRQENGFILESSTFDLSFQLTMCHKWAPQTCLPSSQKNIYIYYKIYYIIYIYMFLFYYIYIGCARKKISCICFSNFKTGGVMILLLCTFHTCRCTIFHQNLSKVWGLIENVRS